MHIPQMQKVEEIKLIFKKFGIMHKVLSILSQNWILLNLVKTFISLMVTQTNLKKRQILLCG